MFLLKNIREISVYTGVPTNGDLGSQSRWGKDHYEIPLSYSKMICVFC